MKIMLKSMWHSLEYVCLSRIKLVLRVIKEISHIFVQWTVLHTEMNNKWTDLQKWTNLWAEKILNAIYFSLYMGGYHYCHFPDFNISFFLKVVLNS